MKHLVLALTLAAAGLALPGHSQEQQERRQPAVDQQTEVTLSGCLKAQGAETFTLKTEAGSEITLTGSTELQKHVGHTVRVTGTFTADLEHQTVQVSAIEHVSDSCSQ